MNIKRLVLAALLATYSSASPAGILDKLLGPKHYHLFHCYTEEAARKCGSDCWNNANGYYVFNVNAADHTVAAKFVGDNPASSSVEYFHGCDISGSDDWTCVERKTLRSDTTIAENTKTLSSVNGEVWELFGGGVGAADGSRWTDYRNNSFCYK